MSSGAERRAGDIERPGGRVSLGRGYVGRHAPDDPEWVITAVARRTVSSADRVATCAATGRDVPLDRSHVYVTAQRSTDHVEGTRTYVLTNERALESWFEER